MVASTDSAARHGLPNTPPALSSEEQALARVRSTKAELDKLNQEILEFRCAHSVLTDGLGQILSSKANTHAEHKHIADVWRGFQQRVNKGLHAWSDALAKWNATRKVA
jgi:hypothetical protein